LEGVRAGATGGRGRGAAAVRAGGGGAAAADRGVGEEVAAGGSGRRRAGVSLSYGRDSLPKTTDGDLSAAARIAPDPGGKGSRSGGDLAAGVQLGQGTPLLRHPSRKEGRAFDLGQAR